MEVLDAAQTTLAAILATGADLGEAIVLVAQAHGPAAARHCLREALTGTSHLCHLDLLDQVAAADPRLARAAFLEWLAIPATRAGSLDFRDHLWLPPLPADLRVAGWLYLDRVPIRSLPQGLWVEEGLSLSGCPIKKLPTGLHVGGNLFLSYGSPLAALTDRALRGRTRHIGGTIYRS
jgi:hypothetical protein